MNIHLYEEIIEEIIVRLPFKSIFRCQCVCRVWLNLIKNSRLIRIRLTESDVRFIPLCLFHKSYLSESPYLTFFLFLDDGDGDEEDGDGDDGEEDGDGDDGEEDGDGDGDDGDEEEEAGDGDEEDEGKSKSFQKRLKEFRKGVKRWAEDVSPAYPKMNSSKYPLPGLVNFELPPTLSNYSAPPELVGHCNGILCVLHTYFILLVNPLSKETKMLRNNPSNPPCLVGFGFDSIETMNFKVVRLFGGTNSPGRVGNGQLEAEVYNLKTNDAWRKSSVFPFDIYFNDDRYTFFNGVIYWCVQVCQYRRWHVLAFNLTTELFQLMDLPQDWLPGHIDCPRISLFVLNQDSLAFVNCSDDLSSMLLQVWAMNNSTNKQHVMTKEEETTTTWTRLYSFGPLPQVRRPISFWNKHKFLYRTRKEKLVLYDQRNGRPSLLFDNSPRNPKARYPVDRYDRIYLKVMAAVVYGASLVSINM